jgi:hypothetical protein
MRAVVALSCIAAGVIAAAPPAQAGGPLETAFWFQDDPVALERMRQAGATKIHIYLTWPSVAPAVRPAGFDAENPEDPAYRWEPIDSSVKRALEYDLVPSLDVYLAPTWAQAPGGGPVGTFRPDPRELAKFARAAARRYSGRYPGLPRVRYWQLWAEQNLFRHLNPQRVEGRSVAPHLYRRMLNAFADAIHSVHQDNLVITGGLSPFTTKIGPTWQWGLGPLKFMREMLCMSRQLKPTCPYRSHFDVWSHNPYTSGGPTHNAFHPDDVSLGDLPEMRGLLHAAIDAGHVVSRRPVGFWVTEFSWDTKPPDPKGVPAALHARWVAEALYRMWANDITLVTWLILRDEPVATGFLQSGLYYYGSSLETARPKPALRAFRFPLVAFPRRRGVYVWGRTPAGKPGRVVVEQSFRGGWRRLGTLRTSRHGIFQRHFSSMPVGWVRARNLETKDFARPFSLKSVPDRFFNPFGLPRLFEPGTRGKP